MWRPSCWGSSSLWWRESLYRSPVKTTQDEIGEMIFQAYDCRADALQLEDQAQVMLTKVLDMTKAGPTNL